jgi:hypothetical protein
MVSLRFSSSALGSGLALMCCYLLASLGPIELLVICSTCLAHSHCLLSARSGRFIRHLWHALPWLTRYTCHWLTGVDSFTFPAISSIVPFYSRSWSLDLPLCLLSLCGLLSEGVISSQPWAQSGRLSSALLKGLADIWLAHRACYQLQLIGSFLRYAIRSVAWAHLWGLSPAPVIGSISL